MSIGKPWVIHMRFKQFFRNKLAGKLNTIDAVIQALILIAATPDFA